MAGRSEGTGRGPIADLRGGPRFARGEPPETKEMDRGGAGSARVLYAAREAGEGPETGGAALAGREREVDARRSACWTEEVCRRRAPSPARLSGDEEARGHDSTAIQGLAHRGA